MWHRCNVTSMQCDIDTMWHRCNVTSIKCDIDTMCVCVFIHQPGGTTDPSLVRLWPACWHLASFSADLTGFYCGFSFLKWRRADKVIQLVCVCVCVCGLPLKKEYWLKKWASQKPIRSRTSPPLTWSLWSRRGRGSCRSCEFTAIPPRIHIGALMRPLTSLFYISRINQTPEEYKKLFNSING